MSLMIDRAFIAILLLSISGFVFCAIFLPFEKYAYKFTSAKTMVIVNTAALFSFVIPFYFIISIIDGSERNFSQYHTLVFEDASRYENIIGAVREFRFVNYLGTIWLLGVIGCLLFYLWKYVQLSICVRKTQFMIDDDVWAVIFQKLKCDKAFLDVKLIGCCGISTPCTVGVKSKYIVIPSYMINIFDEEEVEFILKHEFYHVMHSDLPRKLLVTVLNCLNWFNPLYYFLRSRLSDWMEIACDEEVTKEFNKHQRMKYCQLIIKILELECNVNASKEILMSFAGINMKNYQRRMMSIMKKNKVNGIWGKAVVASVAAISMISGNVVAKAADGPVNQMFSQNAKVVTTEEVEVIEDENAVFESDFVYMEYESTGDFTEMDWNTTEDVTYEIIYKDGTVEILSGGQMQAEPKHVHTKKDVTIKEHKKKKDGSCITTYYDGQKCTSCGLTWEGDVIKTVTEDPCTH